MKKHPPAEDLKQIEQETYRLLEEIGLPFKRVSKFVPMYAEGGAVWQGTSEEAGYIEIYLGCEAGAVAHEIGHGFHEALNHHKKAPLPYPFRYDPNPDNEDDGDTVAEAVRYFVEQRRGSDWRPTDNTQTLDACGYDFERFKAAVRAL